MVALVPGGWLLYEWNRSNVIIWVTPPDSFMANPQFAFRVLFLKSCFSSLSPEMFCFESESAPIDYGKTELPLGLVSPLCFSLILIPVISGSASAWYAVSCLKFWASCFIVLLGTLASLLIRPLYVLAETSFNCTVLPKSKAGNSWVKNATMASFCDYVLLKENSMCHSGPQAHFPAMQLIKHGLRTSKTLLLTRWERLKEDDSTSTSPGKAFTWSQVRLPPLLVFSLTFGGSSCTLGRGQDETTAWNYREAEGASSKTHSSLKNPLHLSLWHCKFRAGEESGDRKPVVQADRI